MTDPIPFDDVLKEVAAIEARESHEWEHQNDGADDLDTFARNCHEAVPRLCATIRELHARLTALTHTQSQEPV